MRLSALFGTLFLSTAVLSGCTAADGTSPMGTGPASAPQATSRADFDKAFAAADAARHQAAEAGGEWRDTASLLQQAQVLAAKNDFAGAVALTDRARQESDLGYQQAVDQQQAGPRFGPSGTESTARKLAFDRAMAAARAAQKQAQSVHNEWRDTASLMQQAEALAAKDELEQATDLAKEAAQQSAMAYAQAKAQANAGPHF